MRSVICTIISTVLVVAFTSLISDAQTVPASVKKEILAYMKNACNEDQLEHLEIYSENIGPHKYGYSASCISGGGTFVLYEKTPSGIKRLFQKEFGMNGGVLVGKVWNEKLQRQVQWPSFNGYYELYYSERSGQEIYMTTYRWNGSRYAAQKERQVW